MEVEDTNVQNEQVDSTETPSNTAETVPPSDDNLSYDEAYDKAFDEIDLDNPDMSLFAEKTNVMENSEQPSSENENVNENVEDGSKTDNDVFGLTSEGYLEKKLVDRGVEIQVTPEELYAFANKGINYERKNADIKPYAEHLRALKDSNVSVEDLASLVDLSKGNKDALKHLISKFDVDVNDISSEETEYTPDVSQYEVNPVDEIWSSFVEQSPVEAEKVSDTFSSLDESFKEELKTQEILPGFIDDVKNGLFEKLLPETRKIKALHPDLSWISAYVKADQAMSSKETKKVPSADTNPPIDRRVERGSSDVQSIWDDDSAYNDMLKQMTY